MYVCSEPSKVLWLWVELIYTNTMIEQSGKQFSWYLDITPNQMFSLYEYPIAGKDGLPLCEKHGMQLEHKEVVVYDREATEKTPPDHCWVCED